MRWTGGVVSYPVGTTTHSPNIVPLIAKFTTVEDKVLLSVNDPDEIPVITGEVTNEGWATVNMHQHLMKVANEPWPESGRDIVFDVKQKIFGDDL